MIDDFCSHKVLNICQALLFLNRFSAEIRPFSLKLNKNERKKCDWCYKMEKSAVGSFQDLFSSKITLSRSYGQKYFSIFNFMFEIEKNECHFTLWCSWYFIIWIGKFIIQYLGFNYF